MTRRLVSVLALTLTAKACIGSSGAGNDAAARPVRLRLPYGIALDASGRLFVSDGGRHQILRWVALALRFAIVAGTGVAGSRGDSGPARRARLNEPTSIVFDRSGNLYATDLPEHRVRRIDRRGTITTFARVRAPVALALHPDGRSLAVASLENRVFRIDLATRRIERLAGDGTAATAGDGGPAVDARVAGPHGLASNAYRVLADPAGGLFATDGDPGGGVAFHLGEDGTRTPLAGTGTLSRYADAVDARTVGILPSDLAFARDGSLLLAQTKPSPAIRRVDLRTGVIGTVAR